MFSVPTAPCGFNRGDLPEKAEVDGVSHGGVAGVFGVEVVSAVVWRCHREGMIGVAGGFVEVDGSVEDAAGENPGVDGLANLLSLVGGITGSLVRGEGGSEDLDTLLVGAGHELAEALFKILGGEVVVGSVWVVESADIVDAFEHDNVAHTGLREDVAIEAGEGVGADAGDEHAVAADPFIENRQIGRGRVVVQTDGQVVGPAVVLVVGGIGAVSNGIAEGDDRSGLRRDRLGVDAFEEIPGRDGNGRGEAGSTDFVAGLDVVDLLGAGMHGDIADLLERQKEANGEVSEGVGREGNGVAEGFGAGGNDDGGLTAENKSVEGAGLNGGFAGAKGDAGGVDAEGLSPELVREADAQSLAGDGGMDNLAQGGADEGGDLVPRIAVEGRCSPGSDPLRGERSGWRGAVLGWGGGEAEQSGKSE